MTERKEKKDKDGEQTGPQQLGKFSVVAANILKMLKMEGGLCVCVCVCLRAV